MIIYTPPDSSVPRLESLTFKMILDSDTGTYKVDDKKSLLEVSGQALYLLDKFEIGSNLTDSSYYEAIKVVPQIEFVQESRGENFREFPSLIPISRVGKGETFFSGYFSSDGDDYISLRVRGELSQTVDTIDVDTIDLRVSCTIYEITSQDFIREFQKNLGK